MLKVNENKAHFVMPKFFGIPINIAHKKMEPKEKKKFFTLEWKNTRYSFACGYTETYKGKGGEFSVILENGSYSLAGLWSIKGTTANKEFVWEQSEKGVKDARKIAQKLARGEEV